MPIPGTTTVTSRIAPSSLLDTYPTHDAQWGKGGYMAVADLTQRDAIPAERRTSGMAVFVVSTGVMYILGPGLSNAEWFVSNGGTLAFASDLALVNGTGLADGAGFSTRFFAAQGDGGGSEWYYDANSTATPVPGLVVSPLDGVGRFLGVIDRMIDIRRLGCLAEDDPLEHTIAGTFDNSVLINAAIQFCYDTFTSLTIHRLHVTIYIPEGNWYIHDPIILKRRVYLEGTGCIFADADSVGGSIHYAFNSGASRIILADNCDCNLVTIDATGGYLRQSNDSAADTIVQDSLLCQVKIKGISFNGNAGNQTRFDCDGIRAKYLWGVTIENCAFVSIKGYQIWLRDCNVVKIHDCYSDGHKIGGVPISKGFFIYSCSDTQFLSNEIGGYNGPGIWLSGADGWLCLIELNLSFNCFLRKYAISGIASNEITTSTAHVYESGSPIEIGFESGGLMPNGLTDSVTYHAIKTSANTLKVALNYEDSLSYGQSGTVTMSIATPLVVSWPAHGKAIGQTLAFTTTGALPTGVLAGTHYYIITTGFTTDSFQVSATPGGAAVATSGTQSGVHTATVSELIISGGTTAYVWNGNASGLYASNDANSHTIVGNRFDQNDSHGITLSRSYFNTIVGNICSLNGHDNTTNGAAAAPAAGVYVRGTSPKNCIVGNTFTSSGANYPQAYGIWIDASVGKTFIGPNAYGTLYTADKLITATGNSTVEFPVYNDLTGATVISDGTAFPLTLTRSDIAKTWKVGISTDIIRLLNSTLGLYGLQIEATAANVLWTLGLAGTASNPRIATLQGETSATGVAGAVTMTSANPGVFTKVAHLFVSTTQVVFATTGALPTNIVAGTVYFVIAGGLTADAFQVAATSGGAAIDTTAGVQSGTHTVQKVNAPSSTLNIVPPKGTGNDNVNGNIDLYTPDAGASGPTAMAITRKARIKKLGGMNITPLAAAPGSNLENGDIYPNSVDSIWYGRLGAQWHTLSNPNVIGVNTIASDAAATFTFSPLITRWTCYLNLPITATRTVTLSTTAAQAGTRARFTRTASATGAFNWSIDGIVLLAVGQWADVEYDGTVWRHTASGNML